MVQVENWIHLQVRNGSATRTVNGANIVKYAPELAR